MRRYLPILLTACFMAVSVIAWSYYLAGYAGDKSAEKMKGITVYTAVPVEEVAVLAQEYEKISQVAVHVIPLSELELLAKIQAEKSAPRGDIILAGTGLLKIMGQEDFLLPYTSEALDMIPERFQDPSDRWFGVWYDPIIWAVNQDFFRRQVKPPAKWVDLLRVSSVNYPETAKASADKAKVMKPVVDNVELGSEAEKPELLQEEVGTAAFLVFDSDQQSSAQGNNVPALKLAMTDFLAADAAANLLYTLTAVNGEEKTLEYLKKLHPMVVQYAKFLATPVRMAGMGEVDIAIAVQSEALRYMRNGFPVQVVYPEEGTACLVTAAALLKNGPNEAEAKQFLEWLIQDAAYSTLQKSGYFYIPTNPESHAYRELADKRLRLLTVKKELSTQQQQKILDKWVQTVRLGLK